MIVQVKIKLVLWQQFTQNGLIINCSKWSVPLAPDRTWLAVLQKSLQPCPASSSAVRWEGVGRNSMQCISEGLGPCTIIVIKDNA